MKPIPSSLFPRLASTVGLWCAIIATVILHWELGYDVLIGLFALGSLWEYFLLLRAGEIPRHWNLGMIAASFLLLGNFCLLNHPRFGAPFQMGGGGIFIVEAALMALLLITLFLREFSRSDPVRGSAEAIAFTLFGVIYIPWLFSFVAKLIYLTPRDAEGMLTGPYYVVFLLVVTKFTDVGAFVCGSLFGRHPFFPRISPKKTWEGIAGALVVALLSGWCIFLLLGRHLPALHTASVLIISLILGMAALAGDLAESLLKRSLHTKDSGHVLPGIGGGLDLIDSVLFTAPLFYFIMQFLLPGSGR